MSSTKIHGKLSREDIEEFEKPSENSQTPHKIALNIDVNRSYSKPSIENFFRHADIFFKLFFVV